MSDKIYLICGDCTDGCDEQPLYWVETKEEAAEMVKMLRKAYPDWYYGYESLDNISEDIVVHLKEYHKCLAKEDEERAKEEKKIKQKGYDDKKKRKKLYEKLKKEFET